MPKIGRIKLVHTTMLHDHILIVIETSHDMLICNQLPIFWWSLSSLENSPGKGSRVEKFFELDNGKITTSPPNPPPKKLTLLRLPGRWKLQSAPRCRYIITNQHGGISSKTVVSLSNYIITSNHKSKQNFLRHRQGNALFVSRSLASQN